MIKQFYNIYEGYIEFDTMQKAQNDKKLVP